MWRKSCDNFLRNSTIEDKILDHCSATISRSDREFWLSLDKDDTAVKNPKRVLKVLTNGDFDREQQCIALTPIEVLKTRGQNNGLTELLVDFETTILPLLK